jgi:DNA-binding CsgD family transcriptional regulator
MATLLAERPLRRESLACLDGQIWDVEGSTTLALGGTESLARNVLSLVALAIPSPGAFACFVGIDAGAAISIERMVDGSVCTVRLDSSLESAFGLANIAGATSRTRALVMSEPWAADERLKVPYLRSHSALDGFSRALVAACFRGDGLYALAGIERRNADPPFSNSDAAALCGLAPLLSLLGDAEVSWHEHSRIRENKDDAFATLSGREYEVARLLVAGYTCENIGARFGVSSNTIRTYTRRLYAKLGIVSRIDLVHHFLLPQARSSSSPPSPVADARSPVEPSPNGGALRPRARARSRRR